LNTAVIVILSGILPLLAVFLFLNRTVFWIGLPRNHRELHKATTCEDLTLACDGSSNAAVLMLHESGGTPESMRYVGEALRKRGFDIYAPAMPGSALTDEEAASLDTPSQPGPWFSLARERLADLRARYREVYLYGASYGGSIALALAQETQVEGIAVAATPVTLYSRDFRKPLLRNAMLFFSPLLALTVRQVRTGMRSREARDMEGGEGAEGFLSPPAVHAQKVFLRKVRGGLARVRAPILVLHARGDRTVDYRNAELILSGVSSEVRRMLTVDLESDLLTRRHRLSTHIRARGAVSEAVAEFFSACHETADGKPKAPAN